MGSNPSLVCVISCGVRVVPDAFLHERARASGESSLMRLSSAPCKNIGVSEHTVSSGGAAMCHRITSVTRMNFRDSSRKLIRVTRIFDRFFDRISRNSTGMKRALGLVLAGKIFVHFDHRKFLPGKSGQKWAGVCPFFQGEIFSVIEMYEKFPC